MNCSHTTPPPPSIQLIHSALMVAYCITFRARQNTPMYDLHSCTSSLPLHHVHPSLQLLGADLNPHCTLHTLGAQLQFISQEIVHNLAVSASMLYKLLKKILSIHHSTKFNISTFSL